MSSLVLRPWTADDCDSVRHIAWVTWKATYGSFIPEADLRGYLETTYSVASLQEKIRTPSVAGIIAAWDGADAAYMIVTVAAQENRCYLSSVYVLPAFQGKGIGSALIDEAGRYARQKGFDRIWLGVMAENLAARSWYERLGFQFTEQAPFTMGNTTILHFIGFLMLDHNV